MVDRLYLIFEVLALLLCLHGLYDEKFKWNIFTIVFVGVEFVIYQMNVIITLPIAVELVVYLVILFYSILQFRGNVRKTIINYITCIVLCVIVQLLCYIPAFFLFDQLQLKTGYVINILFLIVVFSVC